MKNIKLLLLAVVAVFTFNSCEEDMEIQNTNYVTFAQDSYSTGVDPGGSTTVNVPVYTATVSGAERSYSVSVDAASNAAAGSYTVPTSVTIPGGTNEGTLSVTLTDTNLGIGVNNLIINFTDVAGLSNGGSTTISYIQNCTEVTATLDITFDFYASETGWDIRDALGGVVASAAIGTYSNGASPLSLSITLCAGRDYTLTFYDDYGDGMDDGTTLGSYTLTIGGVVKATGGGSFGDSVTYAFDTN